MLRPKCIYKLVFLTPIILLGCQAEQSLSNTDCISLIKSIKETPIKQGIKVRGGYYSVFEQSDRKQVATCLLSQVTNTEPVDFTSRAPGPHPQFVVGDISVFMLVDMYEIPFTTFLSDEKWERMGVFEYYRYIETEGAREKIARTLKPIVESHFE